MDTVYLDELLFLIPKINKRRSFSWKMDAMIASYPYMEQKDRKEFFDSLGGLESTNEPKKFDEVGFDALKMMMKQNPRVVVKE